MENPHQVQQRAKESLWLTHVARLWTCIVNNKKQALKGLKTNACLAYDVSSFEQPLSLRVLSLLMFVTPYLCKLGQ
jgi:hypothetical protein